MSIEYTAPPQSRNEAILADTINDVKYTDPPQSRIEDLLIDLNGKVIGKQDALTEEQLAAVNSGINSEKVAKYDDIYAVMNYNALSHNGIYRGKDLTNIYTVEEIYERVHNGTFEDLYLGDYFTKTITTDLYSTFTGSAFVEGTTYYERSGADLNHWVYTETADTTYNSSKTYYTKQTLTEDVHLTFAAFNYYLKTASTSTIPALSTPHAVMILSRGYLSANRMNTTNTTEGGYYNSEMHQTTLPCYAKSIKNVINNHMITYRSSLTNQVDSNLPSVNSSFIGASTKNAYYNTEVQLLCETEIYGMTIWSSSPYDVGLENKKLPIFNYIRYEELMYNPYNDSGENNWTRSVVSADRFSLVGSAGVAGHLQASNSRCFNFQFLFG